MHEWPLHLDKYVADLHRVYIEENGIGIVRGMWGGLTSTPVLKLNTTCVDFIINNVGVVHCVHDKIRNHGKDQHRVYMLHKLLSWNNLWVHLRITLHWWAIMKVFICMFKINLSPKDSTDTCLLAIHIPLHLVKLWGGTFLHIPLQ